MTTQKYFGTTDTKISRLLINKKPTLTIKGIPHVHSLAKKNCQYNLWHCPVDPLCALLMSNMRALAEMYFRGFPGRFRNLL